jgi:hypothetical protein
LGLTSVSSANRVPKPPASITVFIGYEGNSFLEIHWSINKATYKYPLKDAACSRGYLITNKKTHKMGHVYYITGAKRIIGKHIDAVRPMSADDNGRKG